MSRHQNTAARAAKRADAVFSILITTSAVIVALLLAWILGDIVITGIQYISFDFLFTEPTDAGRSGGIAPILVSTALILGVALVAAIPLGLGIAIWLAEFMQAHARLANGLRTILDVLAGVPSIVYGLFGNAFFCIYLGLGFSILSGGLTLACMILPVFIRTCEAGLRAVNADWRRGGLALGMTRTSTLWHVLLPAARPAIIAGLILGIGRATAETAALIFTSGYVDRMPESVTDSGRALAVHIYDLSMNVTGGDQAAYASALVLILLIMGLTFLAQSLVDRWFGPKFTAH